MQLEVIKADGSCQEYLHTKILACVVNAFGCDGQLDIACELAETVTYYLYNNHNRNSVSSCEIFSIIQAVLCDTGFISQAETLAYHHHSRIAKRARIDVVKFAKQNEKKISIIDKWNKSVIVKKLICDYNLDVLTARMIASAVEEKVLDSALHSITLNFIDFLVVAQMQAALGAQKKLGVKAEEKQKRTVCKNINYAATDSRFRQQQKGLCTIEI